jgi:mono/diheme cytochrome c family protein
VQKLAWPLFVVVVLAGAVLYGLAQGGAEDRSTAGLPPAFVPETVTAPPRTATAPAPPRAQTAAELFGHSCGSCHTLRAARTTAPIGPDLDALRPDAARVRRAIRSGSLDGTMPAGLLTGRDAERVARYVGRVAGRKG